MNKQQPRTGKYRVLIVEDHTMFREHLARLVNEDGAMEVCGEADNIRDAMRAIETAQPDIAVVDISLKGSSGLELVKNLKAAGSDVPVLMLSMHEESLYAERVLAAGGKGYLTKNETSATVLGAIHTVLGGGVHLSPQMTESVLRKMAGGASAGSAVDRLADRELEVFQMIGEGRSTREIAAALSLGTATVETYRGRIKEKLGLRNAAELQQRAVVWLQERLGGVAAAGV